MGETKAAPAAPLADAAGCEAYLLVERSRDGRRVAEDFPAPDDASAIERAREVSTHDAELWCGGRLVARWTAA